METALEKARRAEVIVCAIFARVVTGTGTVGLPEKLAKWVERLSQAKSPLATSHGDRKDRSQAATE